MTISDCERAGNNSAAGEACFAVTLEAAALPVAVVWLEAALDGRWSDNAFDLFESPRDVLWCTDEPGGITPGRLAAAIAVSSLADVSGYGEESTSG